MKQWFREPVETRRSQHDNHYIMRLQTYLLCYSWCEYFCVAWDISISKNTPPLGVNNVSWFSIQFIPGIIYSNYAITIYNHINRQTKWGIRVFWRDERFIFGLVLFLLWFIWYHVVFNHVRESVHWCIYLKGYDLKVTCTHLTDHR